MNTIQQLIQTHLTKYPLMELTDAVKLLYQNGLGPGHMVTDEAGSLKRLCEEWENCINQKGREKGTAFEGGEICGQWETLSSFAEPIGNGLVRVYLHGLKKEELPILNAMFCQTANRMQGSRKKFIENLGFLSFFFPNSGDFLREYEKQGYPPISHSTPYRQAYHPAYRVVRQSHADYLQLIRKIDSRYREKFRENTGRNSFIIAIDGNFVLLPAWQSRAEMSTMSDLPRRLWLPSAKVPPYLTVPLTVALWITGMKSACSLIPLLLWKALTVCTLPCRNFMIIPFFYPALTSSSWNGYAYATGKKC